METPDEVGNDGPKMDAGDAQEIMIADGSSELPRASDAVAIDAPDSQTVPVVFASPHSGRAYPEAFLQASKLDALALRQSEDAFVDQLFLDVPGHGAPMIRALFPRAFVDVNREPMELDPRMFSDRLPSEANTQSPRVNAGLGTIARIVSNGQEIYQDKLKFEEASARIDACYQPYHRALRALVAKTVDQFGHCLLIDCHSMPSNPTIQRGGIFDTRKSSSDSTPEVVLGDCWGRACSPRVTELVEGAMENAALRTRRNIPYAGGFTTRHYGRPADGVHAIQIELRRDLYMDEETVEQSDRFAAFAGTINGIVDVVCRGAADALAASS